MPAPPARPAAVSLSRRRALLAIAAMWLALAMVYWLPARPGTTQLAMDYHQLHASRMQFAREALFSPEHTLPAWYPRQLLGAPFWSNVQSFPFIPTRLALTLARDPYAPSTYCLSVIVSAALAALFMFLFARRIGMGLIGSAAAGWTFSCSGYFASRVAAGHLPLLETFAALPLLLWLAESLLRAMDEGRSPRRWMIGLAGAVTCVALAGHPQLPLYALAVAAIYPLVRPSTTGESRPPLRRALPVWGVMGLGLGVSAAVLLPMVLLVARSTRVLALARPMNDFAMPYRRLLALFLPWRDGAPAPLEIARANPFHGYDKVAYFWDTVCYAGLLPWLAILASLLLLWNRRITLSHEVRRLASFFALLGLAGVVLTLPWVESVIGTLPGTLLRSPARLLYFTEFGLALVLGAGVHAALAAKRRRVLVGALVATALTVHALDLGGHARQFVVRIPSADAGQASAMSVFAERAGDARVAVDRDMPYQLGHNVDDIGFFDSLMLARSYRFVLALTGAPPSLNIQNLSGAQLAPRALRATGVKYVLTLRPRADLPLLGQFGGVQAYAVDSPAHRAEFFPNQRIRFVPEDALDGLVRGTADRLDAELLLPDGAAGLAAGDMAATTDENPSVSYRRPGSDHIVCSVVANRGGWLRLVESWDPGWSATVDGASAPVAAAYGALLAVPLPAGRHEVHLTYHTPGAPIGGCLSMLSVAVLAVVAWRNPGRRRPKS